VLVITAALCAFFLVRGGAAVTAVPAQDLTAPANSAGLPASDLEEYQNVKYKFSLRYPPGAIIHSFDEGGGASTITLENDAEGEGFQIFIVPYNGDKVTQERFLMDDPSGVMLEPRQGLLDGAPASMFFSKDTLLGDTREIWFIRGGYLYEVTAPKVLDQWLQSVIATWRFL
jgi:hypothetical protein